MKRIRKILVLSLIVVLTLSLFTHSASALTYTIEDDGRQFECIVSVEVSDDITQKSNLSSGMFEAILPDALKDVGLGSTLYGCEQEYNINGLFIIAIINHESGYGESRLARDENNLGGVTGEHGYRSFETKSECVAYMFDFLSRKYIDKGRDTIEKVSKLYCVPPEHWVVGISNQMNDLIDKCK